MGNRLSKITTRTGDDGTTGLADGSRLAKTDARVQAIGDIDELNSTLGVLLAEPLSAAVRAQLLAVQHDLFDVGGELAIPGHTALDDAHAIRLETWVSEWNDTLPPLREFILPGGSRASALAHVSRTVCRRAERSLIAASAQPGTRRYVNRLSDLLFVLSRIVNRDAGQPETYWRSARLRESADASAGGGAERHEDKQTGA